MYLKRFVLGDEIKVRGENRIRNLWNGKTIGLAVYGLWLFVAIFGGLSLSGAACGCLCLIMADCGCVVVRRLTLVTIPMLVPNVSSAVFRM